MTDQTELKTPDVIEGLTLLYSGLRPSYGSSNGQFTFDTRGYKISRSHIDAVAHFLLESGCIEEKAGIEDMTGHGLVRMTVTGAQEDVMERYFEYLAQKAKEADKHDRFLTESLAILSEISLENHAFNNHLADVILGYAAVHPTRLEALIIATNDFLSDIHGDNESESDYFVLPFVRRLDEVCAETVGYPRDSVTFLLTDAAAATRLPPAMRLAGRMSGKDREALQRDSASRSLLFNHWRRDGLPSDPMTMVGALNLLYGLYIPVYLKTEQVPALITMTGQILNALQIDRSDPMSLVGCVSKEDWVGVHVEDGSDVVHGYTKLDRKPKIMFSNGRIVPVLDQRRIPEGKVETSKRMRDFTERMLYAPDEFTASTTIGERLVSASPAYPAFTRQ